MNTDKIYAEQLANEYALKDTSKVIALPIKITPNISLVMLTASVTM